VDTLGRISWHQQSHSRRKHVLTSGPGDVALVSAPISADVALIGTLSFYVHGSNKETPTLYFASNKKFSFQVKNKPKVSYKCCAFICELSADANTNEQFFPLQSSHS
jgi:hypothetical protein